MFKSLFRLTWLTYSSKIHFEVVLFLRCIESHWTVGKTSSPPLPTPKPPSVAWRRSQAVRSAASKFAFSSAEKKASWFMAGQPGSPLTYPTRNKGGNHHLVVVHMGNQWLISPDHKAGYFWGGDTSGGVGWPFPSIHLQLPSFSFESLIWPLFFLCIGLFHWIAYNNLLQ